MRTSLTNFLVVSRGEMRHIARDTGTCWCARASSAPYLLFITALRHFTISYSRSRSLSLVMPLAGAGPFACLRLIFSRTFVRATWPWASRNVMTQLIGCVRKLTLRLCSCFVVIVSSSILRTYHSGLPSSSVLPTYALCCSWLP